MRTASRIHEKYGSRVKIVSSLEPSNQEHTHFSFSVSMKTEEGYLEEALREFIKAIHFTAKFCEGPDKLRTIIEKKE